MGKARGVFITVAFVVVVYLIMLVTMPIVSEFASTANTTAAASVNVSLQPGSTSALLAAPLVLWFVPGAIGMIVVVVILRQP